jgi:hypothetical protein
MYVKGSMSVIFNFIEQNETSKHDVLEDLKRYAEMGLSPIMFTKRDL